VADQTDFDEFVRVRSHRLLRLAFALTGDQMHAEDLLQSSLVRAWSAWRRVDGDPEPYVRRILVNTFNSWWNRRWRGERPAAELPDRGGHRPQDDVDDRDVVWRALSQLPRQQRAVLVLRYFEDMSEAQIAEAMSISAGSVKNYASKGLAKLRTDPSLITLPDIQPGTERVASVHARIRQRRRNRAAAVVATVAVIAMILSGYAIRAHLHPNPEPAITPLPLPSPALTVGDYTGGRRIEAMLPPTPFSRPEATLTWTPLTAAHMQFSVECHHFEKGRDIVVSVRINGHDFESGNLCGADGIDWGWTLWTNPESAYPDRMGISPGQTVLVTVSLKGSRDTDPLPSRGSYRVAIAQEVPFEEYPLPPKPTTLEPLRWEPNPNALARFTADGSHEATISLPGLIRIEARSQTPGIMRLRINGVPIDRATVTFWGYDSQLSSGVASVWLPEDMTKPRVDAPATVSVEVQYMTGDWVLEIT
jgi:RNA polymerase sigma-70 factor (sigma-E family)